jgi:hypothetical protein
VSDASELQERRTILVDRAARTTGEEWAHARVAELGGEGRSASGGWPGTITEARSRVLPALSRVLARERLGPPALTEIDGAARTAYARARAVWGALAKADESEALLTEAPTPPSARQRKGP